MYDLVNDVESYPEFLPWCRSATVHERDEQQVRATIEIAKGAINKSFTTRNLLFAPQRIELHLLDGPFRRLEGAWRFETLRENASKVTLDLDYEFSSRILGMVLGPVFGQIADTLVEAFSRRAHQVYG